MGSQYLSRKNTGLLVVIFAMTFGGSLGAFGIGTIYSLVIYGFPHTRDLWVHGGHTSWVHDVVNLAGLFLGSYGSGMLIGKWLVKRGDLTCEEFEQMRLRNWMKRKPPNRLSQ